MTLENKLCCLRKKKGMTQAEVAERLNVSRQAVSRWEVGLAVPTTENLRCLGEIYQVSVDTLLDDGVELVGGTGGEAPTEECAPEPRERGRRRDRWVVLFVAVLVMIAAALLLMTSERRETRQGRPISEMEQERIEDDFDGEFALEW